MVEIQQQTEKAFQTAKMGNDEVKSEIGKIEENIEILKVEKADLEDEHNMAKKEQVNIEEKLMLRLNATEKSHQVKKMEKDLKTIKNKVILSKKKRRET